MAFTAKDVANLREKTGCGMMDCKKALTASDGNIEDAVAFLREKGLAAAQKKASRIAAEGVVAAYSNANNNTSALIEVNSETDFVAKNEQFMAFVTGCAKTVTELKPATVDELLAAKFDGSDLTVEKTLQEKILTIGENLKIRRFEIYEGVVKSYIHAGGRIGVMVQFDTDLAGKAEFDEYAANICMQIAALNPSYLSDKQVPASVIENEKTILLEQIKNDPKMASKPDMVKQKMVDGRINKYYKENCLIEQEYVKDSSMDVLKYTEATAKALGGKIEIVKFLRFEKGEGLEKREDNFAEEVAAAIKK